MFKNWIVFMLTFGLFILSFMLLSVYDGYLDATNLPPTVNLFHVVLVVQAICSVLSNVWFYAIGNSLHRKRYYNSFLLKIFNIAVYVSSFFTIMRFAVLPYIEYWDYGFNNLHLFMVTVCSLYCSYFAALMLRAVETNGDFSLKEFGVFLGFLFYPVGVWWLQPRVNKIFDNDVNPFDTNLPLDQSIKI